MTRKAFVGYVVVPTLATASYLICLWFFPNLAKHVLHSERGLVELATPLAFLAASCLGWRLLVKTRGAVPRWASVIYCLFVLAGLFVALEEVSYGQKLLHWESPGWFAENNSKRETNLHNMLGNRPSNKMRQVATIGCPVICLVMPLVARFRRGRYQPSHWTFYVLPRLELATLAIMTMLLTGFRRFRVHGAADIWEHMSEVRELYWGVIAICFAVILNRRLIDRPAPPISEHSGDEDRRVTSRREAA
jgi:hypothetical protein